MAGGEGEGGRGAKERKKQCRAAAFLAPPAPAWSGLRGVCGRLINRANRAPTGGTTSSQGIPPLPPARVPLPLLHACQLEAEQRHGLPAPAARSRSGIPHWPVSAAAPLGALSRTARTFSTSAGWRGAIGSAKPLSSFPASRGVRCAFFASQRCSRSPPPCSPSLMLGKKLSLLVNGRSHIPSPPIQQPGG